jgi:hypothetical protein
MFDVEFLVCGIQNMSVCEEVISKCIIWTRRDKLTASGDVTPSESQVALRADEVQASEIIPFAERMLFPIRTIDGEEFRSDDITTILRSDIIGKDI